MIKEEKTTTVKRKIKHTCVFGKNGCYRCNELVTKRTKYQRKKVDYGICTIHS